jgi:hypothetical protein
LDELLQQNWTELVTRMDQTALGYRGIVGVIGGVLALAGARLYKFTVVAPGLLLGLLLASFIPDSVELALRAGAAVLLAGLFAYGCHALEQAAVRIFGGLLLGGMTWSVLPMFLGDASPWWAPAAAAGVGLLLFPKLFKVLLKPLTAVLGGVLIALAADLPGNPLIIGGVATVGMIAQFSLFSRSRSESKSKHKDES